MSNWPSLLQRPDHLDSGDSAENWFTHIAAQLLNGCHLMVGQEPHRFAEIEFYYHGAGHLDPFTHRDPIQLQSGRWYFHRTRGMYRGGSFKGLDLTFGDGKAFGGVLIRSIETANGTLIDGPSLCVDHLLDATGAADVATLDKAIAGRLAWDDSNPLHLSEAADRGHKLYRSGRVGLSLKRAKVTTDMTHYIMSPYRYLTEPRRISKGKPYLVLALHSQGTDPETIFQLTGCPRQSIQRYLADFEAGRQAADFTPFFGIDLGPRDLCRLHGTWQANRST